MCDSPTINNCQTNFSLRYSIRIEAMQIKLEFSEKLTDIKPSIETVKIGVEGKYDGLNE